MFDSRENGILAKIFANRAKIESWFETLQKPNTFWLIPLSSRGILRTLFRSQNEISFNELAEMSSDNREVTSMYMLELESILEEHKLFILN
ncbi:hypothetical protein Desaci_3054 [Desulfosporosinus acidiphilus SJ4]|uniref:Uncharacterized protein n=1 Tax=Desulfosporosinus acidiphilus (strain DSM 22704 / JCM 16185 / SJ4) TaxID=646529 RepID=I4D837_DESAJ|nr:hypothetical protein [Desulfosporosinus acidiphilus]AFM41961.1 hypothetical protein Desaci_3054 [Desulfosporosinus acidiphilus SJ4]